MKSELRKLELNLFLRKTLIFLVLCFVFYLLVNIGIWLVNKIEEGRCMLNLKMGDYCLIDSIILTILATAGATGAATLIKTAITESGLFLHRLYKINSLKPEEIINQELTRESHSCFEGQDEVSNHICQWTNTNIEGYKTSFKEYSKESNNFNKFNILGYICPYCDATSTKNSRLSGLKMHWWSGWDNAKCSSCLTKVPKPNLILNSKVNKRSS